MSFLFKKQVTNSGEGPSSRPLQGFPLGDQASLEAKSAGFHVVNSEEGHALRLLRPTPLRRGRAGRRGPSKRGNSLAAPLVPALHLTTSVTKKYRWLITGGASDWSAIVTAADLLRILAARTGATTGVSIFSAFRLVQVDLYSAPQFPTSSTSTVQQPAQLSWVTNATTGTDTKPDDVVPATLDSAHASMVSIRPPAKSILGFWNNVATSTAYFTVFGLAPTATAAYSGFLDVTIEQTLPDGENQPAVFNGTAFPSTSTFQQVRPQSLSGGAVLTPVGYPSYQP